MPKEYVLRVNLKSGSDLRRFCEAHLKGWDSYVFQPRKGQRVKISYHASGQIHLKIGQSDVMFKRFYKPPASLMDGENIWSRSFENFSELLLWKNQDANDIHEIDLPPLPYTDTITLAQVIVGRNFDPSRWVTDGVEQATVDQRIFRPDPAVSGLSVCVRVVRLRNIAT
jgi:hypothetical protein